MIMEGVLVGALKALVLQRISLSCLGKFLQRCRCVRSCHLVRLDAPLVVLQNTKQF